MGQGQSSTDAASEPPVKQDYYELLGVERTATDDELKKAYRRKALELHPDRNHGNEEWATKLFSEIGAAYEILSDPQERAWYDSHRDVLLRGEEVGGGSENYSYNMKLTAADEVLKLMMRFNKNVQYTDGPSGFYGGLSDFFKQLAKEEDIACQWQDLDFLDYPEFGSKDDDYEDIVRPFYGTWTGFATKKSYAWKDQYRLSDAPDRRIRRLMEKENQKIRDEAIAEFNDAVRSLVAFVRKRDPRVQNNQKSEAERQKALRESAAAQAQRMRAQRQKEMEKEGGISTWAHTSAKDEHEGGFSSESDIEEHEYECVVCDKTFKSEKQYQAHEKSKKHIKLLKELKRDMKREGKDLDLEPKSTGIEPIDEDSPQETLVQEESPVVSASHSNSVTEDEDEVVDTEVGKETEKVVATPQLETETSTDSDNSDYGSRDDVLNRLNKDSTGRIIATATESLALDDTPTASGADTPSGTKVGKAKQKRAKKAAKAAESNTDSATCAVCNQSFPSRSKLFDHINKEGHAAPPSSKQGKGAKPKKKK